MGSVVAALGVAVEGVEAVVGSGRELARWLP